MLRFGRQPAWEAAGRPGGRGHPATLQCWDSPSPAEHKPGILDTINLDIMTTGTKASFMQLASGRCRARARTLGHNHSKSHHNKNPDIMSGHACFSWAAGFQVPLSEIWSDITAVSACWPQCWRTCERRLGPRDSGSGGCRGLLILAGETRGAADSATGADFFRDSMRRRVASLAS